MSTLTDQQRKFYETTLQVTKQEINDLKEQVEEELSKVKDRIAELPRDAHVVATTDNRRAWTR